VRRRLRGCQALLDASQFELAREIAQGLVELLLARDALGEVELPADLAGGIEQRDLMATPGRDRRTASPAGPAPTTAIRLGAVLGK